VHEGYVLTSGVIDGDNVIGVLAATASDDKTEAASD
jgi:hypothetical protein